MHLLTYVVPCSVDSREYLFSTSTTFADHASSVLLHLFAICHCYFFFFFFFSLIFDSLVRMSLSFKQLKDDMPFFGGI